MTSGGFRLAVFLDEGAPVLAGSPFLARGHTVLKHGELCEPGAHDRLVVNMALLNNAVLIAVDLDMKRFARRFGTANDGEKYPSLNLIFVGCNPVLAAKRLETAMSFIENEWAYASEKRSRRMWLDIGPHRLTSYR